MNIKSNLLLPALLALVTLGSLGCDDSHDPIIEPRADADYYLVNNTDVSIRIDSLPEATTNIVEPGERVHFQSYSDSSGGHPFPSNVFLSFSLWADMDGEEVLIYRGLEAEAWEHTFFDDGEQLTLVIGDEYVPPSE